MGEHSTFLLVFMISVLASALATKYNDQMLNVRSTRSFPYSMPFIGMLRPQSGAGVSVPVRPDGMDNYEITRELSELVNSIDDDMNLSRQRRDDAPILYKRYACRFKFCRIFDA